MIQFVGVHLGIDEARAASMGRDLQLWETSSSRLVNARRREDSGITEVPAAEWIRSGCFCLQDVYLKLPVAARKVWGLGLSGALGWIALDTAFEPLGPIRLTADVPVVADIQSWFDANPRARKRTQMILSAKDYFRFAVSGGLATDVTTASRFGLLAPGTTQWASEAIQAASLDPSWLPPIFDSEAPTGRLSAEGVTQTRLPAGLWVVAGACETEASLLAGGDLRAATLWAHRSPENSLLLGYGLSHLNAAAPPPGWSLQRSALAGHQVLTRQLQLAAGDGMPESGPDLGPHERALQEAGFTTTEARHTHGRPELGAALLAAIGSKLIRRWESFYKAPKRES